MGFGKFLKKAAGFVLPQLGVVGGAANAAIQGGGLGDIVKGGVSSGLMTAGQMLGGPLAGYLGVSPAIGSAISGGLGGALGSAVTGGNALQGGLMGLAGGYLGNGGLSDLFSGTSLSSASTDPASLAARESVSAGATAATPRSSFLSGYLPSGGASSAGGGTSGGFFSDLFSNNGGVASNGLSVGQLTDGLPLSDSFSGVPGAIETSFSGVPGATAPSAFSSFLSDPGGSITSAIKDGAKDMFSTKNLVAGAGKTALMAALQKDNTAGYDAVADASRRSSANYQPFLQSGTRATTALSDLYGLNGEEAARAAASNWQNTPGYQFVRDQGIAALDASAATKGMLRSGNQEQAVQQYGTDLANQYYQQYLQNLRSQANLGVAGAEGVGQGDVDAATMYALMKKGNADRRNQLVGTFSNYL